MNSRKLQERCDWGDIKGEWEDSAVSIRHMSDKEVTTLVRETNKLHKANGDVIRLRSIQDNSGTNW